MSFSEVFEKKRQVVPRWHTYSVARWLQLTISGKQKHERNLQDDNYIDLVQAWKDNGKLSYAADLVGNAFVLNRFEDEAAIQAAQSILSNPRILPKPLTELSENFLRLSRNEALPIPHEIVLPGKDPKYYQVIANLKRRAREHPRNPILWMDLAFYYSAIGQNEEAKRAVSVALSLNKDNRYLLRSSSRFFMHNKTPDAALSYLRRSELSQHDPWLVAAEIAISDAIDSPSRRIKEAKRMIESTTIPKLHLSELASALGTMEINSGSVKKGRKLFGLALEDPTENSLAQATYVKDDLGELGRKLSTEHLAQDFEAQARLRLDEKNFPASLEATKNWFKYQPFTSTPAVMGSYIASVALGRFEEAIEMADSGRQSSPNDVMLANNLAFSLASVDKIDKAADVLDSIDKIKLSESEAATLAATRGMIKFRSGHHEEGRTLYKSAVESFRKGKDLRSEAIAKFFWAKEEDIVKSSIAQELREDALKMAKRLNLAELLGVSRSTEQDKLEVGKTAVAKNPKKRVGRGSS